MKEIISRYETKSGLKINDFDYLYNGNKINIGLTLDLINDKDKEILIFVNPKEIKVNEDGTKKSDLLNSFQFTNQTTKSLETGNIFGKKQKNIREIKQYPAIKNKSSSEIELKIKIEQKDVNQTIYFLDNTKDYSYNHRVSPYYENDNWATHYHAI